MGRIVSAFKHHSGAHPTGGVGAQEVRVRVRGGYEPDTIRARVGVPLRLVFHREESSPCSEQVVFPAFGKSVTLPQGEQVAVDLLPTEPGAYEFTCAMGMLRGQVIVLPHERAGRGHARRPTTNNGVQAQLSAGGDHP